MLSDNFACLSVCQWLCACYRLETGWCIDEAGLPIHYHQCLGSTIPCHIPPLLTCAILNQPSQSPQRHRRQTVHLYIGHREKLHTGTRTLAIVIDINTHQRSWEGGGHGTWDMTTPSLVAKQSMDPSSSCPGPLQPVSRRTGGRECSADQQQVFYPAYTGNAVVGSAVNQSLRSCTVDSLQSVPILCIS